MGLFSFLDHDHPLEQATRLERDDPELNRLRRAVIERLEKQSQEPHNAHPDFQQRVEQLRAEGVPLRSLDLAVHLAQQTRLERRQHDA